MTDQKMSTIEMLARMWMTCDPNRDPSTADQIIGRSCCSSVNDDEPVCVDTPLTGKPGWHWFIPRAEASLEWFEANGFTLEARDGDRS